MDLLRKASRNREGIGCRLLTYSPLSQGAFSAMLKRVKITKTIRQELLTQGNIIEPPLKIKDNQHKILGFIN